MTRFYRTILALLVIGILCIIARGVGESKHDEALQPSARISEHIKALESKDRRERRSAYEQAIKQRQNDIAALIALAEKQLKVVKQIDSEDDPAFYAIQLLGDYRAVEAVPFLVNNISLPYAGWVTERSLFGPYPCAASLVKIGKPAVEPVLDAFAKTEGEVTIVHTLILKEIEGIDCALIRVQAHIDKEADPKKKARLEAMLKYFEDRKASMPKKK